jgi:hypothetical protein
MQGGFTTNGIVLRIINDQSLPFSEHSNPLANEFSLNTASAEEAL